MLKLSEETPTTVFGEDTDLLVLLCHHANMNKYNIYFKSDSGFKKKKIWDITATNSVLGSEMCHILPFVHAFSGCDTVSRIYGIGKSQLLKKAISDPYFKCQADVFLKDSNHDQIEAAGKQIVSALYNGNVLEELDSEIQFVQKVNSSSTVLQVQTLPPTKAATKYHSYRAYLQVKQWTGTNWAPLEWGCCHQGDKLFPL